MPLYRVVFLQGVCFLLIPTHKTYIHKDKCNAKKLKHYHHIRMDKELVLDCEIWLTFLYNAESRMICRPFSDINSKSDLRILNFYMDASKAVEKGIGCIYNSHWSFLKWKPGYIKEKDPSIQYLELYALCMGIFILEEELQNMNLTIFCDNESVQKMVNETTSSCKNCMYLIRLLILNNLRFNRKIWVEHVESEENTLADSLSRMEFDRFWENAPEDMDRFPRNPHKDMWPASKLWQA